MDPKTVGIPASSLVLGKLSGRHAFKERLAELGYSLNEAEFNRAFAAFKGDEFSCAHFFCLNGLIWY